MIVVDSSVWVELFRDRTGAAVDELEHLVRQDAELAITDVVLAELLAGARSEREVDAIDERLRGTTILGLRYRSDFRRAGWLRRHAREQGFTIRSLLDCLIASVCIREGVPILHLDRDFDHLAEVSPLVVHPAR